MPDEILDKLGEITKRLDYLGPIAVNTYAKVLKMEGVVAKVKNVQQIKFSRLLTPGQGVTIYEKCLFAGYIKHATIHWPGGCNALVDVAVGHGNTQFCPEGLGEFLFLDNATPTYPSPTYPFDDEVSQGEEVWVIMRNRDAANNHSITVTVSVVEK